MVSLPVNINDIASNGDVPGVTQEHDVIIVGAGFSGISSLHRCRKEGLKAHIFEAASDFGGVWFWNRYPGARVDSEMPFYQLSIPEVYNTWTFSQRFPDHVELRKYMTHVDKVLNLSPDVSFNTRVYGCTWDAGSSTWTVRTETGVTARAQFLILATGLLHKAHMPQWPGQEKYQGLLRHSGDWPESTDVTGKKVAVIGAGATAVQIIQELGKSASQLTVLMRRPSYCIPMRNRPIGELEQAGLRAYYPTLFAAGRKSAVGFPTTRTDRKMQDVDPVEREEWFEKTWAAGGFQFLLRNYNNVVVDKEANRVVYDFWKRKVRERVSDEKKWEMLCPDEAPYYFSTKRSPLEQDYYEVMDQSNVDIVDINKKPIEGFTEKGLILGDEDREFDVVVCATGFDAFTGSLTNMGLKSKNGVDIKDVWKDGVRTYLGMMFHGFPNAFMVYSPQAPTALSNGPTIIECQCDFAVDTIKAMRAEGSRTIEPTRQAEEEWKAGMDAVVAHTLFPYTNSWWNTSNVPGKKAENQTYILGIDSYELQCREKMTDWKGFQVVGPSAVQV